MFRSSFSYDIGLTNFREKNPPEAQNYIPITFIYKKKHRKLLLKCLKFLNNVSQIYKLQEVAKYIKFCTIRKNSLS